MKKKVTLSFSAFILVVSIMHASERIVICASASSPANNSKECLKHELEDECKNIGSDCVGTITIE